MYSSTSFSYFFLVEDDWTKWSICSLKYCMSEMSLLDYSSALHSIILLCLNSVDVSLCLVIFVRRSRDFSSSTMVSFVSSLTQVFLCFFYFLDFSGDLSGESSSLVVGAGTETIWIGSSGCVFF